MGGCSNGCVPDMVYESVFMVESTIDRFGSRDENTMNERKSRSCSIA